MLGPAVGRAVATTVLYNQQPVRAAQWRTPLPGNRRRARDPASPAVCSWPDWGGDWQGRGPQLAPVAARRN